MLKDLMRKQNEQTWSFSPGWKTRWKGQSLQTQGTTDTEEPGDDVILEMGVAAVSWGGRRQVTVKTPQRLQASGPGSWEGTVTLVEGRGQKPLVLLPVNKEQLTDHGPPWTLSKEQN